MIGRDFDGALLERVLGFEEDRFLLSLEEALDAGLIGESPGDHGRYTFTHALIRETLYEGMSFDRRSRVHRRVGLALEQQGDAPVNALAHHFTRAAEPGDAERAIRYALEAGAQATAMLANEEAAEHYARALDVLERSEPEALDAVAGCCWSSARRGCAAASGPRRGACSVRRRPGGAAGRRRADGQAAIGAARRFIQPPGVVDEEMISCWSRRWR